MEAVRGRLRVLHVLRSVMLAGAGAVVWMALSSTAASADSGTSNNHALLGGAESAVASFAHTATAGLSGTVRNSVPENAASVAAPKLASVPAPAALPVVQAPAAVVRELPQLTQAIDHVAGSTPIVNVVVPAGTVGAVTAPVISPAAGAVARIGTGVGTLVDGAVINGVVAPALRAVGSTVEALPVGLPVTIPDIPATIPAIDALGDLGTGGTPSEQPPVLASVADGVPPIAVTASAPLFVLGGPYGPPVLGGAPWNQASWNSGAGDPSASDGTFPDGVQGGRAAGNGSATLPINPSGAATPWLPGTSLFHPLAGALVSTAAAGRVPAPVSFDPGSSPD